ncbi:MAG: TSUP family transporter [Sphingomonas sp.]|uniref:TSUP family transporter n=1 Tax=Sphingomonas sp. TaxID=28214 RepID=UPI003F81CC87
MTLLLIILVPLAVAALAFIALLARRALASGSPSPRPIGLAIGAVTNFFDTLGIGSFAPTMAWLKLQRLVPDRLIPSTMVAGHSLPVLMQSAVFLILLGAKVDGPLLAGSVVAMVIGGQIGAPLARHAPIRLVQAMVATALIIAAIFYVAANLGLTPHTQASSASTGLQLGVSIVLHLLLGVLLNFGVGNYAPTLLVFSLIGIDPKLAFPVMSSACAYCIITSGIRVLREDGLDLRMVSGIAIGGVPAVLVAALVVKAMPLTVLRWLVVAVVLYASAILWRSSLKAPDSNPPAQ